MDKQAILEIAKLSKLTLTDDEVNLYLSQFGTILKYMEQLSEVNTDNIEPYMTPITGNIREDVKNMEDRLDKKTVLDLAYNHDDDYIIVPKVL